MKRLMALWAATAFGIGSLAAAPPAEAHPAADFYSYRFAINATEHWVIDNNVPSGNGFRDQVKAGIGSWDDGAGGNGPNFVYDGEATNSNSDFNECTGGPKSQVFTVDDLASALNAQFGTSYPAETVLGYTDNCRDCTVFACEYIKFEMTLERSATYGASTGWNTSDGPPASNEYDLRSTVTHEAGHATGWRGHFANGGSLCPTNPDPGVTHTMCPAAYIGTTFERTKEPHDEHTYANAY